MITSCVPTLSSSPPSVALFMSCMPPPGAVCPAIVMYGFVISIRDCSTMVPPTRKTQVRGPLASTHARSDPPPRSLSLLTPITTPPRPPTLCDPQAWAPANAASGPAGTGVETPLPLSAIVAGEFAALLFTNTLPVTEPVAVGAKFTLNVVLCPAPKLSGVNPLIVKPAPETLSEETFTLVLPVLLNVTVWLLLLPTFTFPKLKLLGPAASWLVAFTPVPLSAMLVGELEALLISERFPVALLAAEGAKLTVNAADLPGATVSGRVSPLKL